MISEAKYHIRNAVLKVAPDNAMQRLRAYRKANAFRKAGVVFIQVPKAAGSSISAAVYGQFIGHFSLKDMTASCPADVLELPSFSVVRNPWARLVSAWSFARLGRGFGGPKTARIVNPSQYDVSEFQEFSTFVLEWLAQRNVDDLDYVFRPQFQFLTNKQGAIGVDHLGRVEDMKSTSEWLSEALGRTIKFEHGNQTAHGDYRRYYNDETSAAVGRIYAQDVKLLGYESQI